MSHRSSILANNNGLIRPAGKDTNLKPLSFRRAVPIVIVTVVISMYLASQFIIVAVLDNHYRQQEEQQQLRDLSLRWLKKHSPDTYERDGKTIDKSKKNLRQHQESSFAHPSRTLINTSASVADDNKDNSGMLKKNYTTWPITLFSEEDKTTQQCWLSSINDMLGCGYDGHAFTGDMHCHQKNDANGDDVSHYHVVFKVAFKRDRREDDRLGVAFTKDRVYVSEEEKHIEKWAKYYEILLGNTSTTISEGGRNMRDFFHLPFGTVKVPPARLWEVVAKDNKCWKDIALESEKTKDSIKIGLSDPPVLGIVMEYAGTQILHPDNLESANDQRRVVKDIVCIYDHMHKRNFIHEDILYRHFLYDGDHVSLIDFDRSRVLGGIKKNDNETYNATGQKSNGCDDRNNFSHVNIPGMKTHTARMWGSTDCDRRFFKLRKTKQKKKNYAPVRKAQLFQLLSLIGSICTKTVDKFPELEDEKFENRKIRDIDLADHPLVHNWTLAFKQCSFMKNPSLLFQKNASTAQTYQLLTSWTGGCSNIENLT